MLDTAKAFIRACDEKGLKYHEPKELDSGKTLITLGVSGSAGNSYDVKFTFDTDNEGVWVYVPTLMRTDNDHYARILITCNKLNNQYRWLKFVLDDDKDVGVETDAVIDVESAGPVCVELFMRIMSIVKNAYPVLMKEQWSQG